MNTKMTALAVYHMGKLRLPPGYHIACDAELLTLHRQDGSVVAAFGAHVAPSMVVIAAAQDYKTHGKSSA
jgi:hypothetical protein